MKRLPLATTEILKHFVFVIPPSEELTLLEEKREVESEAELSAIGTVKVRSKQFILTLAGLHVGRKSVDFRTARNWSWWWESAHGGVFPPLSGDPAQAPAQASLRYTFPGSDLSSFPRGD